MLVYLEMKFLLLVFNSSIDWSGAVTYLGSDVIENIREENVFPTTGRWIAQIKSDTYIPEGSIQILPAFWCFSNFF